MIKTISISILSLFILSGCISLTKELPAQKTYSLSLEKKETLSITRFVDKTIRIHEAKALNSINTKEITYSKKFEQEKYALSKWSDKPTKMLQEVTADYLTKLKRYKYITTSNIKVDSDYKLLSELTSFKHIFTKNKSYADFSIRVYFINNKTEKVYFKSFTYNQEALSNDAQGLVDAMNITSNNFLNDLGVFIQKSIDSK